MVWCSQPKCVHGAEYRIKVSGRLLCKHCAGLLDKAELATLSDNIDIPKELT